MTAARTAVVCVFLTLARASRELLIPLKALSLGLDAIRIGAITTASFAADTALVPVAGWLMDAHGRRAAGTSSLLLSAVGFVCLALANTPLTATAAAVVMGVGNGLSNGWVLCVGADLAPPASRARFLGTWNLMMSVGNLGGPLLVGATAQVLSIDQAATAVGLLCLLGSAWYVCCCIESKGFDTDAASGAAPMLL